MAETDPPLADPPEAPTPEAGTVAAAVAAEEDTGTAGAGEAEEQTGAAPEMVSVDKTDSPPDRSKRTMVGGVGGEDVMNAADKEAEEDGARGDGDRVEAVESLAKLVLKDRKGDASGSTTHSEVPESETSKAANDKAPADECPQEYGAPSSEKRDASPATEEMTSRIIKIPENKVGCIIGRSWATIKSLEFISGARIDIIADKADPHSSSRPVGLTGCLESINKAEQLIKDVMKADDMGHLYEFIASGFGTKHSGHIEMHVPLDKADFFIGRGGQTVKNIERKTGANIKVPRPSEGVSSKQRKILLSGNFNETEAAKRMIMQVINESSEYQLRDMNAENPQHHPHGRNFQQAAPRVSMGAGWDQRSGGSAQVDPQGGAGAYSPSGVPFSMVYNYRNLPAPTTYGQSRSSPHTAPGQQSYAQRNYYYMQPQQYYVPQPAMNSWTGYQPHPLQQNLQRNPAYAVQHGYGPPGGYGQYPFSQAGNAAQAVANRAGYGYYAMPTDVAAYGNTQPAAGYVPVPLGNPVNQGPGGYAQVQPQASPAGVGQPGTSTGTVPPPPGSGTGYFHRSG